jgi:hypothetical protein
MRIMVKTYEALVTFCDLFVVDDRRKKKINLHSYKEGQSHRWVGIPRIWTLKHITPYCRAFGAKVAA